MSRLAFVVALLVRLVVCRDAIGFERIRGLSGRIVMPWMCLQDCGDNVTAADIDHQIADLSLHLNAVKAVSFEWAHVTSEGIAEVNPQLSNVSAKLASIGVLTSAMVTSGSIETTRAMLTNRTLFLLQVGALAKSYGSIANINFDIEPASNATEEDAQMYADFVWEARVELGLAGFTTSFDIASWSDLWGGWRRLNDSAVRSSDTIPIAYLAEMSTYSRNFTYFAGKLDYAVAHIAAESLMVGLQTHSSLNSTDVAERFAAIAKLGITKVAIWRVPIPHYWWPIIDKFVAGAL